MSFYASKSLNGLIIINFTSLFHLSFKASLFSLLLHCHNFQTEDKELHSSFDVTLLLDIKMDWTNMC